MWYSLVCIGCSDIEKFSEIRALWMDTQRIEDGWWGRGRIHSVPLTQCFFCVEYFLPLFQCSICTSLDFSKFRHFRLSLKILLSVTLLESELFEDELFPFFTHFYIPPTAYCTGPDKQYPSINTSWLNDLHCSLPHKGLPWWLANKESAC